MVPSIISKDVCHLLYLCNVACYKPGANLCKKGQRLSPKNAQTLTYLESLLWKQKGKTL